MKKAKKRRSLRAQMVAMDLGIVVASLLLCGLIFVFSVWLIMQKYIENDLDFFLTQTADNLNTTVEYLETAVSDLRKSDDVMNFLEKSCNETYKRNHKEKFQSAFEKVLNISSQKNNVEGKTPLAEKIYLFSNEGDYYSSFYYALLYSQVEESDQIFQEIYRGYAEKYNPDYAYIKENEERLYLLFPLLDEEMEQRATVIFEIRLDALRYILSDVEKYQNAFWTLYDKRGNVFADYQEERYLQNLDKLQNTWKYSAYQESVNGQKYRVYSRDICMNLRVTLGIPKNQTVLLMFDSLKLYTTLIIIVTMLSTIVFIIVIYRLTKPLKEVSVKLKQVQEGHFNTKLPDYAHQEFYEISQVFNDMTSYINHLIKQVYEKQISIKEMEVKFLQTQMNPHFMFNVLNTIGLKAKIEGNEEVYLMIHSFSQLIQAKIYRKDTEKIQIRQELEYVKYYLYLQNFRYGSRLSYQIEVEEEALLDLYIPKLCLQLIVENAVVHGIEPMVEDGEVKVEIYCKGDTVFLDTTDNGVGFADGEVKLPLKTPASDQGHNHVGLNNAQHLMRLMYGEPYGVYVFSKYREGTKVSIRLPRQKKEEKQGIGEVEEKSCSE